MKKSWQFEGVIREPTVWLALILFAVVGERWPRETGIAILIAAAIACAVWGIAYLLGYKISADAVIEPDDEP